MLSAQLLLLLLAGGLGMAALSLALPILPLTVAATTHDPAVAGVVTGVVAAFTVALELLSPALLGRFRARPLLVAAMLLQLVAMAGFAGVPTLPAMLARTLARMPSRKTRWLSTATTRLTIWQPAWRSRCAR